MTVKKIFAGIITIILLGSIFLVSCVKDNTDELQADHDRKMEALKETYGIDESDLKVDGIYLKLLTVDTVLNPPYPSSDDMIIADYIGTYFNGSIFDVSDSAVAQDNELYNSDFIYGPARLWVSYTFLGFQKAKISIKSKS